MQVRSICHTYFYNIVSMLYQLIILIVVVGSFGKKPTHSSGKRSTKRKFSGSHYSSSLGSDFGGQ